MAWQGEPTRGDDRWQAATAQGMVDGKVSQCRARQMMAGWATAAACKAGSPQDTGTTLCQPGALPHGSTHPASDQSLPPAQRAAQALPLSQQPPCPPRTSCGAGSGQQRQSRQVGTAHSHCRRHKTRSLAHPPRLRCITCTLTFGGTCTNMQPASIVNDASNHTANVSIHPLSRCSPDQRVGHLQRHLPAVGLAQQQLVHIHTQVLRRWRAGWAEGPQVRRAGGRCWPSSRASSGV